MRSDLLLFLVWILFLLGTQMLKKKKRPQKRVPPPASRKDPGPFVCEEAQAPAVKELPLQPSVKPVRSDLVEEIRDLKPTVAPQVAEIQKRRPDPVRYPALSGGLRQGMLWSLVLGEPRSRRSWAQEKRNRRNCGI